MARPFIEFVQSQWLAWQRDVLPGQRAPLEVKVLSHDTDDGGASLLVRYPPNWSAALLEAIACDEELFLLRGQLTRGNVTYGVHDYAYLPAGFSADVRVGPEGAVAVTFLSAHATPVAAAAAALLYDESRLISRIDTLRVPWDRKHMDPNIGHLYPSRKNLRLDPAGRGRTYLLGGLPQGFPASASESLERHPHHEEMFMVSGDMPCSRGVMRAGAYFWRPPGIWHGADCSLSGFLMLMRTPGVNATVSEWDTVPHPVRFDPLFDPALPPGIDRSTVAPLSDPVDY